MNSALRFTVGDPVIVSEGQLVNLYGRVLAIEDDQVTIMPKHEDLKVSFVSFIGFVDRNVLDSFFLLVYQIAGTSECGILTPSLHGIMLQSSRIY